jgi:hypothetical protein
MRGAGRTILITTAILITLAVWRAWSAAPQVWPVGEVPTAWWAWRNETPTETELSSAMHGTRTRALFLRAGQLDDAKGQLRRIRSVEGVMPRGIELHLVCSATRSLLADYERIETADLAQVIAETFSRDRERAVCDGAQVAGLQLDLDVPTRLLPRYAQLLAAIRRLLPAGIQLSITGLPSWLDSAEMAQLLRQTDFWIPQCYGSIVPQTADQAVPIASASQVRRTIERVR